jgi:hypothetical protein
MKNTAKPETASLDYIANGKQYDNIKNPFMTRLAAMGTCNVGAVCRGSCNVGAS